ncbi:hypothetical protein ALCH109712_00245 [Alkalicoccus chagannorensis]
MQWSAGAARLSCLPSRAACSSLSVAETCIFMLCSTSRHVKRFGLSSTGQVLLNVRRIFRGAFFCSIAGFLRTKAQRVYLYERRLPHVFEGKKAVFLLPAQRATPFPSMRMHTFLSATTLPAGRELYAEAARNNHKKTTSLCQPSRRRLLTESHSPIIESGCELSFMLKQILLHLTEPILKSSLGTDWLRPFF